MMTEREGEILRQALIGPGGKTVTIGGVEYVIGLPEPETQSEIAKVENWLGEDVETLLANMRFEIEPSERYHH